MFLVDSSASVGADNFYNEVKFIRKLLADFTVSVNTTRVVVITYSSVNQAGYCTVLVFINSLGMKTVLVGNALTSCEWILKHLGNFYCTGIYNI